MHYLFGRIQLQKMRTLMKSQSPMKRTTLNSKDFSTRVTRILMVSPKKHIFDSHFFFLNSLRTLHGMKCYDSPTYPFWPFQSQPHLQVHPQSTTRTWWSPTCGPSCRSLWRKTLGCRKELRTWKRRGTSFAASWTASSFQQRARDRSRVRASTVMVRTEDRCEVTTCPSKIWWEMNYKQNFCRRNLFVYTKLIIVSL